MAQRLEHLIRRGESDRCWGLLGVIVLVTAYDFWTGGYVGAVLGVCVALAVLAPSIAQRSPHVLLPWEVLLLTAASLLVRQVVPWQPVEFVGNYLVLAAVALVLAVEVHVYTRVEMNRPFATAFVAMVTMTAATAWTLGRWSVDLAFGTTFLESNEALMWELLVATAVGVGAGVLFDRYFGRHPPEEVAPISRKRPAVRRPREDASEPYEGDRARLSERLGLSARRQRRIVWVLQFGLVCVIALGVVRFDVSTVLTGVLTLTLTFLPAILRRDIDTSPDVGLVLWLTSAVSLHALGTVYLYGQTFWWHNVTHTVSGSLVAGVGYTLFRAIDGYTAAVRFPQRFVFVLIVLFVVSAGVLWEIVEFLTDQLMHTLGYEEVLVQYGLDDTMTDVLFNVLGAIVVATWGTTYLTGVVIDLRKRLRRH